MPGLDLILILVSGMFLKISSLPVWLHGFKYVSHFYYGLDAVNNIFWRQIENIGKFKIFRLMPSIYIMF